MSCVGPGSIGHISVPYPQFCYEHKTALIFIHFLEVSRILVIHPTTSEVPAVFVLPSARQETAHS